MKGLILGMQGNYKDAENSVDKGLLLDPNNSESWATKGIIAETKGDKTEAIFDYKKAIKLNPDDTESLIQLYRLEHPSNNSS